MAAEEHEDSGDKDESQINISGLLGESFMSLAW